MTTIDFFGEQFRLRETVSQYALLKFARAARDGQDSGSPAGLAAMMDLLEKCIHPEDWKRFDEVADANDATGEQIQAVIQAAFTQEADRPIGLSSDSSDGQPSTEPKSLSNSEGSVSPLLRGRPDRIAAVEKMRQTG